MISKKRQKKESVNDPANFGLDVINKNVAIIEYLFKSFGYIVKVMEINYLRVNVQYCIEIKYGTPVEEIINKEKELALALASPTGKVKIKVPIPNTHFIGIYLPKRNKGQKEYTSLANETSSSVSLEKKEAELKILTKREIESLIEDGKFLIKNKEYSVVSIPLFKNTLMIGDQEATIIFEELKKELLINNFRPHPEDPETIIADVDLNALRQMLEN